MFAVTLRGRIIRTCVLLILLSLFLLSCLAAPTDNELQQGVPAEVTTFHSWVDYLASNDFLGGTKSGTAKYGLKLRKARSLWADVLKDRKTANPPSPREPAASDSVPSEANETFKEQQQQQQDVKEISTLAPNNAEASKSTTQSQGQELETEQTSQMTGLLKVEQEVQAQQQQQPTEQQTEQQEQKEKEPQKPRHRKVEARRPPTTTSIDPSSLPENSDSSNQKQQRHQEQRWGRKLIPASPVQDARNDNPHRGQSKKKSSEHSSYYDRPRPPSAEELEASCAWYVREQKYEKLKEQIFMQEDARMFQVEHPYAQPEENLQFVKRKRDNEIVQQLLEKRKAMEAALAQIEKELAEASAAAAAGATASTAAAPLVEYSCSWQFSHYSPSDWEVTWATHISDIDLHQGICKRLRTQEELERSVYMLKRIEEFTYRENNERNRQVRNTIGEPYKMDLPDDSKSSYRGRPISNNQKVSPLSAARKLRKQNEAAEILDNANNRMKLHDTTAKMPLSAAQQLAAEEVIPSWKSRELPEQNSQVKRATKYGLELFKAEMDRDAHLSAEAKAAAEKAKPLSLKDISAQLYRPDAIPTANNPANYATILLHYEARRRIVEKELQRRQALAEKEAQREKEKVHQHIKAQNVAEFNRQQEKRRAVLEKQFTSTRIVVDTTLNTIGNVPRGGETAPLLEPFPDQPEPQAAVVVEEPKVETASPPSPPPQPHQHVETPHESSTHSAPAETSHPHQPSITPSHIPAADNPAETSTSSTVTPTVNSSVDAAADGGLTQKSDEDLNAELQKIQSQLDALSAVANEQQAADQPAGESLERHGKRLLATIQATQPTEQVAEAAGEVTPLPVTVSSSTLSSTPASSPEHVEAATPVEPASAVADSAVTNSAAVPAAPITEPFEIVEEEIRLGTSEEGAAAARRHLLFAFDGDDESLASEPAPVVSWADFGVDATNSHRPLQIGTIEYVRDVADQLFSRMNYNLICRAGGGAYEASWASTQQSAVFTVAKGFDFIEPLIGLLRDPLTMCERPHYVPLHLTEFLDTSAYRDVQSKRHLLMQAATPYQITMRPVTAASDSTSSSSAEGNPHDVDGILPAWYTESIAHQIRVAIDTIAGGSGLPPWAYRHSYPIPHSPRASNANPPRYRSEPLQPSYSSRVMIPPQLASSQIFERPHVKQNARSEDEEHTAIIVNNKGEISVPAALTIDHYFTNPRSRRRSRSAPRVLLFDLGASYFAGWDIDVSALGSAWFYQQMVQKGLMIDRVYAWEYETLDPVVEWKSIPAELYSEFSFINTGVTSDPSQTTNPWNTLLEVARPIDYVIVKLDIDSAWIEGPLMEQLLNTPNIQMLIDEMFFEHHVDVEEMRTSWGLGLPQKIGDTYDWFTVLRQTGIRMHSWP